MSVVAVRFSSGGWNPEWLFSWVWGLVDRQARVGSVLPRKDGKTRGGGLACSWVLLFPPAKVG